MVWRCRSCTKRSSQWLQSVLLWWRLANCSQDQESRSRVQDVFVDEWSHWQTVKTTSHISLSSPSMNDDDVRWLLKIISAKIILGSSSGRRSRVNNLNRFQVKIKSWIMKIQRTVLRFIVKTQFFRYFIQPHFGLDSNHQIFLKKLFLDDWCTSISTLNLFREGVK